MTDREDSAWVGTKTLRVLAIVAFCAAGAADGAEARDQGRTLPLEFRLDRDYYTSEKIARVRAERRVETGGLRVRVALAGSEAAGELRAAEYGFPAGARRDGIWEIDIAKLAPGSYTVRLEVHDAGKRLGRRDLILRKYPPAADEIKYDWDNNVLVNGKPFFPIGYFSSRPDLVAVARRQGFNCVVEWPFPNVWREKKWPTQQLLDEARRCGMRAILTGPFNRHGPGSWGWNTADVRIERARRGARTYKNHPALLCYFTQDEPHSGEEKELRTMYHEIRAIDPYHPVFINHWWTGPEMAYKDTSDWVGKDMYPVFGGCFTQLARYCQKAIDMTRNRKPFVFVTQSWSHPLSRHPSRRELRHMVYLLILRGTKAVLFYIYQPWPLLIRHNGELIRELNDISPILLSDFPEMIKPTAEKELPGKPPPETVVMPLVYKYPNQWPAVAAAVWRRSPDKFYVIATNRQTGYAVRATFKLPELGDGRVKVVNENRRLPLRKGRWTDDFQPLDVHIYELTAGSEGSRR